MIKLKGIKWESVH